MDVWLLGLGAAVAVLIGITVWVVFLTPATPELVAEEAGALAPQGDQFEDQYTSATADLSAGGVAIASANPPAAPVIARPPVPASSGYQSVTEPWSSPTLAHEGVPVGFDEPAAPERPTPATKSQLPRSVGLGVAALLTLGGAIGGAWLYARWQRQRNASAKRLRRRLIK